MGYVGHNCLGNCGRPGHICSNMYKLNEEITLIINRQDAHFDRACEGAAQRAIDAFDVDEDGHINGIWESERSRDSI